MYWPKYRLTVERQELPYFYTGDNNGPQGLVTDGCLAHKTAVAAGALVIYLRYIINPGPLNLGEDPGDFRQRFLMSNEFTRRMKNETEFNLKKRHAHNLNAKDMNPERLEGENSILHKVAVGENNDKKLEGRIGGPGLKVGAMNNNILAAQLHGSDREKDNYYQDDGDYKEKGYENDMYPQNQKDGLKHMQRLVQFDNDGADKNKEDDYDEDDYDDDQDDNGDHDNYEYHNNNNHGIRNNINFKNDKQPFVPKPDETDDTYYDENHKHDDYNNENEQEQGDLAKDKVKPAKQSKDNLPKNEKAKFVPEKLVQDRADIEQRPFESTQLPKAFFVFILVCSFALLIVMYRFIKNRRIHIRYHPRTFLR